MSGLGTRSRKGVPGCVVRLGRARHVQLHLLLTRLPATPINLQPVLRLVRLSKLLLEIDLHPYYGQDQQEHK
jgi:hypothetical protein